MITEKRRTVAKLELEGSHGAVREMALSEVAREMVQAGAIDSLPPLVSDVIARAIDAYCSAQMMLAVKGYNDECDLVKQVDALTSDVEELTAMIRKPEASK